MDSRSQLQCKKLEGVLVMASGELFPHPIPVEVESYHRSSCCDGNPMYEKGIANKVSDRFIIFNFHSLESVQRMPYVGHVDSSRKELEMWRGAHQGLDIFNVSETFVDGSHKGLTVNLSLTGHRKLLPNGTATGRRQSKVWPHRSS